MEPEGSLPYLQMPIAQQPAVRAVKSRKLLDI
jgi:hypothetical protein